MKDFRYILKRVLIGFLTFLLIFLFKNYILLGVSAQTNTYTPTATCVINNSGSSTCKGVPNVVVGGNGFNIWFQDVSLLEPNTTYYLDFRIKIKGLDSNVVLFNDDNVRSTKIFTGNNGTASSEAIPDRNENFTFYHVDRDTAWLIWSFELDSLSTFNTIRLSSSINANYGSVGGVTYLTGGILEANLRISSDTPPSGGGGFDDSGIINNANDNTQNIINNNNNNTQNIIDNNNNNTQSIIDNNNSNFRTCRRSVNLFNKNGDLNYPTDAYTNRTTLLPDGTLRTTANVLSWASRGGRLLLKPNTNYTVSGNLISSTGSGSSGGIANVRAMGYDSGWASIAEQNLLSAGPFEFTFNSGNSTSWFLSLNARGALGSNYEAIFDEIQVEEGTTKTKFDPYGLDICTSKLDETNNNLENINNSLNDDNVDSSIDSASNFFSNFSVNHFGLSGVVTAPLRLINSLTSSTCNSLQFPLPFVNQNVVIPCMSTIYNKFPLFYNLWQLITTGLVGYRISINLFKKVKDIQDPDNDRIEVLDL